MVSKPHCLGDGALWFCRHQEASSASGYCDPGLEGLAQRCGEVAWRPSVPRMGHPHHPGHTLQFRVLLSRPGLPREWKEESGFHFIPRGLKKPVNARHTNASPCASCSREEGELAGFSRRWSASCLLLGCSRHRELVGESKAGPEARWLTQLG